MRFLAGERPLQFPQIRAFFVADDKRVSQVDEQAVFDGSRDFREVSSEFGRSLDGSEVTVEHEVAVVGDDGTILAFGCPEGRLAAQFGDCVCDHGDRVGQHFEWNGVIEDRCEFSGIDHDDEPIGGRVDVLFPGVGRAAALDQISSCGLVGSVDGDVGSRLLQRGQRNSHFAGELTRLIGGGNAPNFQALFDCISERPDRVGCRTAGAQPDHGAVLDEFDRPLAGGALFDFAPARRFHVQTHRRSGQKPSRSRTAPGLSSVRQHRRASYIHGAVVYTHMATTEPAVVLADVRKVYRLGEPVVALDDVSLSVPRGSYTAVMGPSGSGKSTLMNMVGCLDTPTDGRVEVNDRVVTGLDERERTKIRGEEVGFVFQTFNLMPRLTARENVALPLVFRGIGRNERRERAQEALQAVELGDRADHRPNELSGGQRQRVAIARALVTEPAILLADEPTGNLDSETGAKILQLFDDLHEAGNTIMMVTHERHVAERAERIVHLLDGAIEWIEELDDDIEPSAPGDSAGPDQPVQSGLAEASTRDPEKRDETEESAGESPSDEQPMGPTAEESPVSDESVVGASTDDDSAGNP